MIVVKNRRVACAVTVAPQLRMSFKMAAFVAILAAATWACAQNSTETAQDDSHKHQASTPQGAEMKGMQHDVKPLPPPSTPTLGALQANPQQNLIRLDELEQLALKNNPTLAQAAAEISASKGRRSQSGLWPNPTVGYTGEEIRGGSFNGGQQGFFVEQDVILGSKLALNQKVLAQEVRQAELESEEQELRVKNAVRLLYYQALAAQETVAMRKELSRIASESAKYDRQLLNVGQQNETEVLNSEVEAEQADLAVIAAEHSRRRAMASLASVVSSPAIESSMLAGSLEQDLPALDEEQTLRTLLQESPGVRIAQAGVQRAEAALLRARREAIPDLRFRGGLEQNREIQESTGRPVGFQGFAEVGLQLKLFNRNQGGVEAAQSDLERARKEVKRIELVLRERAASFVDSYSTAQRMADRYRTRILPLAQRSYELIYKRYGLMQASYPQVLGSEHALYKLETDYISSLNQLWFNAIALKGFLLTDGLEAPTSPSDVDRRVREINLPSARTGAMSPE
jgi:cobalt-zinc-cadmium efflux system outer membrane protein